MNAKLVMFKGDGTRRDFPLRKNRVVIGRTSTCDLRIPLSSVSRKHCEIVIESDSVKLRDLGSSNGTLRNDDRVQETAPDAGDRITVGPVVFTLVVDGEPQQIETVRSVVAQDDEAVQSPQVAADDVQLPVDDDDDQTEVDIGDPISALDELAGSSGELGQIPLIADADDEEEPNTS